MGQAGMNFDVPMSWPMALLCAEILERMTGNYCCVVEKKFGEFYVVRLDEA